jgi:AcrR family transcriptional regulator
MSPRTEKQFEEIRQEKRQVIMQTALGLFAENGFKSTTIHMIASKAGISKGLIYNYFLNKEALLETLIHEGLDSIMENFDRNKDGILEPREMEFFLRESVHILKQNTRFWKLFCTLYLQPRVFTVLEKKLDGLIQDYSQMMVAYFEAKGYKNAVTEALMFGSLLDGAMIGYIIKPDVYPIDQVLESVIERYCR